MYRLAKAFAPTEFSPPDAQFVKEACDAFSENMPPNRHLGRESEVEDARFFSIDFSSRMAFSRSVTWADAEKAIKQRRMSNRIKRCFILMIKNR